MDIEFCECGGILMAAGRGAVKCRSCGKELLRRMNVKMTTKAAKDDIVVVDDNKPDRLPDMQKKCPKCGHGRAYWWLIQTRAADEPPTQFFRCANEKCKYTWREYK